MNTEELDLLMKLVDKVGDKTETPIADTNEVSR